jgi:hypothetical protein
MYVYRDTGGPEEESPAPAKAEPDEREAAYWYGVAEPEQPEPEQEARGPFEPLVSSSATSSEEASAGGAPEPPAAPPADAEPEDDDTDRHAQKLEQIKDFYLTAEAIGEENVDKHFDRLLAQQRELISEYFKHSKVTPGDGSSGEAGPDGAGHEETTQAEAASTGTDW